MTDDPNQNSNGLNNDSDDPSESGASGKAGTLEPGDNVETVYTLKVNGQERRLTLDEMKAEAQKQLAGDDKLRQASEIKRENQRLKRMHEDIAAAQQGDESAIRRLATYPELNVSQEQIDQYFAQVEQGGEQDSQGEPKPLSYDDMPPEVKKAVERDRQAQQQQGLEKIKENINRFLDKDEVLGHIVKQKGRERVTQRLVDHALSVVRRAVVQEGRQYGPEVLAAAVQETRAFADDLGIQNTLSFGNSAVPGIPGLPQSPAGSAAYSGFRNASKPPDRLPPEKILNDQDYAKNLGLRLVHAALQGVD